MKTRIINAFIEETKMNGIKFTMDELAKRLGISKRTLYENFSSKVEILNAIIDSTLEEFEEQSNRILNNDALTLVEKVKQTIKVVPTYNDFYDTRILEQLERYYPVQWEKAYRELNEWDDLRIVLQQGADERVIVNHNIDLLVKIITQSINTTMDKEFFFQHSISAEEALDSIVDVLLNGIVQEQKK